MFGPETRFEVRPAPPAPFRETTETELDRLKNRLIVQVLGETTGDTFNAYVREAANDAAALAWVTAYPLLVFPELFAEKAQEALRRAERQKTVRRRSLQLVALL